MEWYPVSPAYDSFLRDESGLRGTAAEIAFPQTEAEVCDALRQGNVTLRGSGTGLRGGAVPRNSRILDLSRLSKLGPLQTLPDGTTRIRAQAGVTLETLRRAAPQFLFPPDPTEETATLGGIFALGATGPGQIFYGNPSQYVESLRWATPGGDLWEIRRGQYASAQGRLTLPNGVEIAAETDLVDLLCGSEGRLGAALDLELRLLPKPADLWGILFFFRDPAKALEFGRDLGKTDCFPANLTAGEFFDRATLDLLDSHRNHPLLARIPPFPRGAGAACYVELRGDDPEANTGALMTLLDLFEAMGGEETDNWAENGESATRKFRDLRHAVPSILNEIPGIRGKNGARWELNFRVEPALLPALLPELAQLCRTVPHALWGHLTAGSLSVSLLPETGEQRQICPEVLDSLAKAVLRTGGDPAAEYGMGRLMAPSCSEKIAFLEEIRRKMEETP